MLPSHRLPWQLWHSCAIHINWPVMAQMPLARNSFRQIASQRLNRYLCHRPYCGGHSVPKRCCAAAFIVSKVDTAQIEKCYTKQTRQTSKATSLLSALVAERGDQCPLSQQLRRPLLGLPLPDGCLGSFYIIYFAYHHFLVSWPSTWTTWTSTTS